jgi:hypothetical protein
MQRRRRIKQTVSLHDRLAAWAKAARELGDALPPLFKEGGTPGEYLAGLNLPLAKGWKH